MVCVRAPNCARKGRGGKKKKKRESLNVTLLSTVTTLTTCDVSARIIIAHRACAEQAPSPPRALGNMHEMYTGMSLHTPQGGEMQL